MPLDLFSRKLVLLVEDEPLIALDIEHRLRSEGVRVITAGHLDAALYMAEHPDLSGAVVDLCLGEESATPIFRASRTGTSRSSSTLAMPPRRCSASGPRPRSFRNPLFWTKLPTPSRSVS